MAAHVVIQKHATVREYQEWRPQNRRPHREVVYQMAGICELGWIDAPFGIQTVHPEAGVCLEPVLREVEVMLDQQRTRKGVITHAVSMHPGIAERQREKK